MAIELIDLGTVAQDGADGDLAREAFIKVNANFTELDLATVTQAEAEAGVSTTKLAWTAQRVAQAVRGGILTGLSLAVGGAITATDTVISSFGKLQKQITDAATNLASNVRNTALTGYVVGTNTVLAATDTILTAFGKAQAQINSLGSSKLDVGATAVAASTLTGLTASVGELNYTDGVTSNIQTQLNTKAPLASPPLTGVPTAPTAAVNTNTTQLATTAFVNAEIANDAPTKTGGGASGTWGVSVTGNAATATALQTARTINGVSFNGTANITVADATKQPLDATLTALAGVATAADQLIYATGADTFATATLTAQARALLDDVDAAGMRSTLGVVKQTSSTDATAGSLMTVGAFGLGTDGSTAQTRPTDCNLATVSGFYQVSETALNRPTGAGALSGFLLVYPWESQATIKTQEFIAVTTVTRKWARVHDGISWRPWVETYHTGNILGTVSQSAGVPTGAIIERGSNANGEYVRYADGTQICNRIVQETVAITTAAFGGFKSADSTWTYPAGFAANPSVIPIVGGGSALSGVVQDINLVSTAYHYTTVASSASIGRFMVLTAIGRWF